MPVGSVGGVFLPAVVSKDLPRLPASDQVQDQIAKDVSAEEAVKVSISGDSATLLADANGIPQPVNYSQKKQRNADRDSNSEQETAKSRTDTGELSEDEEKQIQELRQRDSEVRTHEQQHVAAGGAYVRGGIQYDYQVGPDGRPYAIGGSVDLDTSEESTPEATLAKANVLRASATAPQDPSSADRAIAMRAGEMETEARKEIQEEQQEAVTERNTALSKTGLQKAYSYGNPEEQTGILINITA